MRAEFVNQPKNKQRDDENIGQVESGDEVVDQDAGDIRRGKREVFSQISRQEKEEKIEDAELPNFKLRHRDGAVRL